jgi:hypothetical protein
MSHASIRAAAVGVTALVGAVSICAAAPPAAGARPGPRLNDTGITLCIDAQGRFIGCEGTGQDAALGRDVTFPRNRDGLLGFHFTRRCNSGERAGDGNCPAQPTPGDGPDEWGCTRDDVTGLLWETKTASGERAGTQVYTFYTRKYDPQGELGGPHDATGYVRRVNAAGLCGLHDWRLPTPVELMGIAAMGATDLPAIDLRFMPNTVVNFYWAAGAVRHTFFAKELGWGVDFAFGLGEISTDFRESPRPVRLVHGPEARSPRFVVSADRQEVEDRQTGLAWRRCVEGAAIVDEACAGRARALSWIDALAHAQRQAHRTGVSWRLPNVKELASLLDHGQYPYIDVQAFPGAASEILWSSSSFPADPTPRCVSFPDGLSFSCSQGSNVLALRLVRDGDGD